jgi:hypothetical protein
VQDWKEKAFFEAKIQFDPKDADPQALSMNHYDPEVWKTDAQPKRVVVDRFGAWLRPWACLQKTSQRGNQYFVARLAGHNVKAFDCPRLQQMFKECDQFLAADAFFPLDTLHRALWYFAESAKGQPANFKLPTLCEHFGILTESHEALADVRACVELAKQLTAASEGGHA